MSMQTEHDASDEEQELSPAQTAANQERALVRWATGVSRAAGTGAALRRGFALFGLAMKAVSKGRLTRKDSQDAVKQTGAYLAFFGTFSAVYLGVDEALARRYGSQRSKHWRAALAGFLAGPSILLSGPESNLSLALYIHIRALVLLVRCGLKRPHLQPWLRPLQHEHGDTALMSLAAGQLLYAWIYEPASLPRSYINFLNTHGGKHPRIVKAIAGISSPDAQVRAAAMVAGAEQLRQQGASASTVERLAGGGMSPLEAWHQCVHPDQSALQHMVTFPVAEFLRALPVYAPVYIVPALVVHRKKLLDPGKLPKVMAKVVLGVVRSAGFLSAYCTLAWAGAEAVHTAAASVAPPLTALGAALSGLGTLVEKKSRRMELALYCAARAVESKLQSACAKGQLPRQLPRSRGLDVLLFSSAMAILMHCYNTERDVFRSKYINVFDFMFGNTGHAAQAIRHVPSNLQLMGMAEVEKQTGVEDNGSVAELEKLQNGHTSHLCSHRKHV